MFYDPGKCPAKWFLRLLKQSVGFISSSSDGEGVRLLDGDRSGLPRSSDKKPKEENIKKWNKGTNAVRSHTAPGLFSLSWPPCHVASMRTKHPATVVSIQNQAALVIPMLFYFFYFFIFTTTKLIVWLFLHGRPLSSNHVWKASYRTRWQIYLQFLQKSPDVTAVCVICFCLTSLYLDPFVTPLSNLFWAAR